jgi:gamma-glutamylputrescine oxidase
MGDAESLGLFERIRQSSFPGGSALRLPLLLAGTSFYRLRDWLS